MAKQDRQVVGSYPYDNADEPDDVFNVIKIGDEWFWEFCCVWALAGPFKSEEEAIAAGRKELKPDGTHYFAY